MVSHPELIFFLLQMVSHPGHFPYCCGWCPILIIFLIVVDGVPSWSQHQKCKRRRWDFMMFTLLSGAARNPGHGTKFMRGGKEWYFIFSYGSSQIVVVTNSSAWHHEMSWHQRLQEVSLYQFVLTSKSIL